MIRHDCATGKVDLGKLSAPAWEGLESRTSTPNFNASKWLIGVVDLFGPDMAHHLVHIAVEEGHYIEMPQEMERFLNATGKDITELKFGFKNPLPAGDIGYVLKATPNLSWLELTCFQCGPGQSLPESVTAEDGFSSNLATLRKLDTLRIFAFSLSAPILKELISALRQREMLPNSSRLEWLAFQGYGQSGFDITLFHEFGPLCIEYLEARNGQMARRCDGKHICKSKCTKHTTF